MFNLTTHNKHLCYSSGVNVCVFRCQKYLKRPDIDITAEPMCRCRNRLQKSEMKIYRN